MRRENNEHRTRASVIVFDKDKNQFLMMYRRIGNEEKFVLLGGGVEPGETLEEAAVREVKEESNLDIKLDKKLTEIHYQKCIDHVFLSTTFSGNLKVIGEELVRNSENNYYSPQWIKVDQLNQLNVPIHPRWIVRTLLNEVK